MKNMAFALALATIFWTKAPAYAQLADMPKIEPEFKSSDFNISAMEKFTDFLLTSIQEIYQPHAAERPLWSHEEFSAATLNTFDRLQSALFGDRKPIKLKSCSSCGGYTDFESGTIFIQPSYLDKIEADPKITDKQEVEAFILAHEFGHVIQGLSVSIPNGPDINGLPSLITASFGANTTAEDLKKIFTAHAEVDAYGLILMKKAGFTLFKDAATALELMRIKDDRWNSQDIDTRESRISHSLESVWQ